MKNLIRNILRESDWDWMGEIDIYPPKTQIIFDPPLIMSKESHILMGILADMSKEGWRWFGGEDLTADWVKDRHEKIYSISLHNKERTGDMFGVTRNPRSVNIKKGYNVVNGREIYS